MSIIQGYRFFPHWGNEKYLLKEINAGMLCEYFPVLLESKELQDLSPDDNPIICLLYTSDAADE